VTSLVQALAMALVAALGLAVVLIRDLGRQAVVSSIYGLLLVVLFVAFQAPDVALSALVVSAVAFPLLLLLAVAKVHARRG
jgi:energy-converting hydrogenase B subunit D